MRYASKAIRFSSVSLILGPLFTPSQCTNECASSGDGWNSNIMIVKRTEASVLISWTQDTPTTVYEVIWGQQQQSVALEIGQEIVRL